MRSARDSPSHVSRSSGQALRSASWLISTLSADRVSSRSAANTSRAASTSAASAGFLPSVSSGRVLRSAVSVPSAAVAVSRMKIWRAAACWRGWRPLYARSALAPMLPSIPPAPLVVRQGEDIAGPVAPRLVQGVGQMGKPSGPANDGRGASRRWRGADRSHKLLDECLIDSRAPYPGRLGYGEPELALGHRAQQIPVLGGPRELLVVNAADLEIGTDDQDNYGRRQLLRTVAYGGGRVQGGNEGMPLGLIRTLREDLLELVDDDQQAPPPFSCSRPLSSADSANPAGSARSVARRVAASEPASAAT